MLAQRMALGIAVVAALAGSQGPEFAQQYRQRAGGALDELQRVVERFDAEAAHEGLTPAEGVKRLERNADPLARARGEDMERTVARAGRLEAQLTEMASAGPLMRLVVFARDFDPAVAHGTLDVFEPAAPLTFEALTTGAFAGALGYGGVLLVASAFRRRPRPRALPATA